MKKFLNILYNVGRFQLFFERKFPKYYMILQRIARGVYFMVSGKFPEEELYPVVIVKQNMNIILDNIIQNECFKKQSTRVLPAPPWFNFRNFAVQQPKIVEPVSQFCTQLQFEEPVFYEWCDILKEKFSYHRKIWEFVYIMQALRCYGYLKPGNKGLGFGVGTEPLPAAMALFGCGITATDLPSDCDIAQKWAETNQYAGSLEQLNVHSICPKELFINNVTFKHVDMNNIPKSLKNFNFVWSSCALEHLGNMKLCRDFIFNSMDCLSSGGIAVHTTEFNLSSENDTLENGPTVLFRYADIEKIANDLREYGYSIDINFSRGTLPFDNFVDFYPYSQPHINLVCQNYVSTSFGLIIKKF